ECANFFHGGERRLVVDTRKGFADIELFAVAIEVAMVVGGELRIAREFAGEHAARKRHSRQDADTFRKRLSQEKIGRPLTEAVEDDLHGLYVGIFDSLQG